MAPLLLLLLFYSCSSAALIAPQHYAKGYSEPAVESRSSDSNTNWVSMNDSNSRWEVLWERAIIPAGIVLVAVAKALAIWVAIKAYYLAKKDNESNEQDWSSSWNKDHKEELVKRVLQALEMEGQYGETSAQTANLI